MNDTQVKEGDQGSWQSSSAWSGNRPGGPVANVATDGQPASITANRSNEVSKNAEPSNPTVHVERPGNDVVKQAPEVTVEKEGDKPKEAPVEQKEVTMPTQNSTAPAAPKQPENGLENKPVPEAKPKEVAPAIPPPVENKIEEAPKKEPAPVENGEAKIGDKRPAEEPAEEKKDAENGVSDAKKQKTDDAPAQPSLEAISNGTKPEAPKVDAPKKKETPKKETKKREPKRAATETGEPRRSSRHAAK